MTKNKYIKWLKPGAIPLLIAIMVNYGYIISIFSDPLGLGWDLFNLANVHFKPFIPQWIPFIQGLVLLTGLYLGLTRGNDAVKEVIPENSNRCLPMILPSLYALFCVNLLLKIFLG